MMTIRYCIAVLLLFCFLVSCSKSSDPEPEGKIRVACIGNSITYGAILTNRDKNSYPAVLNRLLGDAYHVGNFGVNGAAALSTASKPYMQEDAYLEALDYRPDVVIIKLGTNDCISFHWTNKNDYKKDMMALVASFQALPSNPLIYLCYPVKYYYNEERDNVIVTEIIPVIDEIVEEQDLMAIDLHTATENMPEHFPDNLHPNEAGTRIIAETVYAALSTFFRMFAETY